MKRLEENLCIWRRFFAQPLEPPAAHFPAAGAYLQPAVRGGQPLCQGGEVDGYPPTVDLIGPGMQFADRVLEVESLRCAQRQIVAQDKTAAGVGLEIDLNALSYFFASGLQRERLSVEGQDDVVGQGATRGNCAGRLRDTQNCGNLIFPFIVQSVYRFDLEQQGVACCKTGIERVGEQDRRRFQRRQQEYVRRVDRI